MSENSAFKDLLSIFNAGQVRYLIVGGYAVMKYAEPRYTKDLDVWIETTGENASRVFHALRKFGAPLSDLTEEDLTQEGMVFQIGVAPNRVDILMGINGVRFSDAWSKRVEGDFDAAPAHFISRSDLIVAKRAAGRPQDLIDADVLSLAEDLNITPDEDAS